LWVGGYASCGERLANRPSEVETSRALLAPTGQPGRQLPGQRPDGRLHVGEIAARCVHQVDVLDQRATQGAGHRLATAVGDETASDLILDLLAEPLDQSFHLFTKETLIELGEVLVT